MYHHEVPGDPSTVSKLDNTDPSLKRRLLSSKSSIMRIFSKNKLMKGVERIDEPLQASPSSNVCDLLEVWFAGCHEDVGGGSVDNQVLHSLSDISLHWMVRQVIQSKSGVIFDQDALVRAGLDVEAVYAKMEAKEAVDTATNDSNGQNDKRSGSIMPESHQERISENPPVPDVQAKTLRSYPTMQWPERNAEDATDAGNLDAFASIYDQLVISKLWWILEVLPTPYSYQDATRHWHHTIRYVIIILPSSSQLE
jgi:Uncharacterized alpha/beta hydrolase domain (DUF2235)